MSSGTIEVTFMPQISQGVSDESIGYDNIRVTVFDDCEGVGMPSAAPVTTPAPVMWVASQTAPPLQYGSIAGNVSEDTNGDGAGNTDMEGVTVMLYNAAGTFLHTTTTNSIGMYFFSNLSAGDYTVQQVNLPGYVDSSSSTVQVTVLGGQITTCNFVDERPSS